MKSSTAQHCLLLGIILVLFLFVSSVHYFSHTFIEFRKKMGFLDFTGRVDTTIKIEINETSPNTIRPSVEAKRVYQDKIEIGEILPNCGLPQQCPDDSFPIHIFTGNDKDDEPRLCIIGKYVIGSGINKGGRGINAALIEPTHFRLVSVKNFDTYGQDSSELETWIESEILVEDIVIFFTFDEASKELSNYAKKLLYDLGSYRVQDLHFRSQWYMISQRGIQGFTRLETLKFAKNNRWADAIDLRLCVPRKIDGQSVAPDPLPTENGKRNKFCKLYNGTEYSELCEEFAQREPLTAAMLTNRTLIGNLAYSTPILVLSGSGREGAAALLLTLDSLSAQPGLSPAMVLVVHDDHSKTPAPVALATLFAFQSLCLPANLTQSDRISRGLKMITEKHPDKKYVIVIQEDLILSPDFMFFMAQTIPLLEKDSSLLGVSAWNPNGFEGVSGDVHLAYRIEEFPGAGFLLPVLVYKKYLEFKFNICCSNTAMMGWPDVITASKGHIIVPDVSRLLFAPTATDNAPEEAFFNSPRVTNIDATAYINRALDLEKNRYFQSIANIVHDSTPLHMTTEDLNHCRLGSHLMTSKIMQEYSNKTFVIYYKEDPQCSGCKLRQLVYCFGVPVSPVLRTRGLYEKLLRMTVNKNIVLLIEGASPFFKTLPRTVTPL